MYNYKLTIQYDGTNYNGWQSQPNGNTVQDRITDAINQVSNQQVNLIGSGRTDSGVHALGQVANFKIHKQLDLYKFKHSLNSILEKDIAISEIIQVNENFNSRFDAKLRSYIYLITQDKSPFFGKYTHFYTYMEQINVEEINELSKVLIGVYDFTSFCKSNTLTENKICDIKTIRWKKTGNVLIMLIEANRFLHNMVRTIVGTLLHCLRDSYSGEQLKQILNSKDRSSAFETAPAKGLFLYKVKY